MATMTDSQRLNINEIDPDAYKAVLGLESYVRSGSLEPGLVDLIKIRASQLNGCAFCLDMHNRDARASGEDQRRLDVLSAWREALELFTARECAALAFTEAVTLIGEAGVPDAVWDELATQFDQAGIVHLLMAVAAINVGNCWREPVGLSGEAQCYDGCVGADRIRARLCRHSAAGGSLRA